MKYDSISVFVGLKLIKAIIWVKMFIYFNQIFAFFDGINTRKISGQNLEILTTVRASRPISNLCTAVVYRIKVSTSEKLFVHTYSKK